MKRDKVAEIFREWVGDEAGRLDGSRYPADMARRVSTALQAVKGMSPESAREVGFHVSDWQSDAAFLVALALSPERFTDDEVAEGVEGLLIHAPAHLLEACRQAGIEAENIFVEPENQSTSGVSDTDEKIT